ncbi:MAG: hypothetical protein AB1657_00460 [Candidatus Micrarchaeota archaeon]
MRAALLLLAVSVFLLLISGCVKIREEGDCAGLDGAQRDSCYSDAAFGHAILGNRDAAVRACGRIDDGIPLFGSDRDLCYMRVAEVLKDTGVCNYTEPDGESSIVKNLCVNKATPVRSTSVCATAFVLLTAAAALFAWREIRVPARPHS